MTEQELRDQMENVKCMLDWEGDKWIAPVGFVKNGKDGCERKVCNFTTCHNYGRAFLEPNRLEIRKLKSPFLLVKNRVMKRGRRK